MIGIFGGRGDRGFANSGVKMSAQIDRSRPIAGVDRRDNCLIIFEAFYVFIFLVILI